MQPRKKGQPPDPEDELLRVDDTAKMASLMRRSTADGAEIVLIEFPAGIGLQADSVTQFMVETFKQQGSIWLVVHGQSMHGTDRGSYDVTRLTGSCILMAVSDRGYYFKAEVQHFPALQPLCLRIIAQSISSMSPVQADYGIQWTCLWRDDTSSCANLCKNGGRLDTKGLVEIIAACEHRRRQR